MKKTLGVLCALALLAAIPAQAAPITYYAALSGPAEEPPNASPGTGEAWVTFDAVADTLRVKVNFSGLLGNVTAAHIHCCTATPFAGNIGVATATPTFPGFPSGVTAGSYDQTFDTTMASTFRALFITNEGGHGDGRRGRAWRGPRGGPVVPEHPQQRAPRWGDPRIPGAGARAGHVGPAWSRTGRTSGESAASPLNGAGQVGTRAPRHERPPGFRCLVEVSSAYLAALATSTSEKSWPSSASLNRGSASSDKPGRGERAAAGPLALRLDGFACLVLEHFSR
jgi:hypothetical protein